MSAPGDEMLSRVAGRLYWAGRQLIRAEDTARAILSQHGLAMTPQGRELADWPALVAALGHPPLDLGKNSAGADRAAVALLAVDLENPGSVRSAVAAARENMRSARGLLPEEAWRLVTDLRDWTEKSARSIVGRQSRVELLRDAIRQCRAIAGVLLIAMRRGGPRSFINNGMMMECADMDCRLLLMTLSAGEGANGGSGSGSVADDKGDWDDEDSGSDDLRWRHLLLSLGLSDIYRAATFEPARRETVLDFIVADSRMPRSLRFCLDRMRERLEVLPNNAAPLESCAAAARAAAGARGAATSDVAAARLTRALTALRKLDDEIREAYFPD